MKLASKVCILGFNPLKWCDFTIILQLSYLLIITIVLLQLYSVYNARADGVSLSNRLFVFERDTSWADLTHWTHLITFWLWCSRLAILIDLERIAAVRWLADYGGSCRGRDHLLVLLRFAFSRRWTYSLARSNIWAFVRAQPLQTYLILLQSLVTHLLDCVFKRR